MEIMKLPHLMRVLSPSIGAAAVYALLVAHPSVCASLGETPALTYGSGCKDLFVNPTKIKIWSPLITDVAAAEVGAEVDVEEP